MKRIVILLALLFVIAQGYTQRLGYGILGGATIGAVIGPIAEGSRGSPSISGHGGIFGRYHMNDKWGFELRLLYNKTGVEYSQYVARRDTLHPITVHIGGHDTVFHTETFYTADVAGAYNLQYFNMEPVVVWKIGKRFGLSLGPRVSFLLAGRNAGEAVVDLGEHAGMRENFETDEEYINALYSQTNSTFDEREPLYQWDFGGVLGVRMYVKEFLELYCRLSGSFQPVQRPSVLIQDQYYNVYMNVGASVNIGQLVGKKP